MDGGPPGFPPWRPSGWYLRTATGERALSLTGLSPSLAGRSRAVQLTHAFFQLRDGSADPSVTPHNTRPATPAGYHAGRVWAIPVSLATTQGMLSVPRGTEMFQFPRCPPRTLCIRVRVTRVRLVGFPHWEMFGSPLATSSPNLFAGNHVLHRPLAPRHPPCALSSLT